MKILSQFDFPDAPVVPVVNWRTAAGLDYAGFSVRGGEAGGDYSDFVPMANGEFAVMLGEADTKGREAEWVGACIRGAVRGFLGRGHVQPMRLATELNRIIYELCSLEQVVSFLYGHFSARTGVFTYVNAGHETALLVQNRPLSKNGYGARLLEISGPVLGLRAVSTYRECSIQLRPGDRVIALTTGVLEGLALEPEISAEAELLEIARDCREADSRELANAVLNRITLANILDSSRDRSLMVVSKNNTEACPHRHAAHRELALA